MSLKDLERGLLGLANSEEAYRRAEGYYTGRIDEFFASERIKTALEETGKRFRLSFAAIPVDVRVARMTVTDVSVPGSDAMTAILRERIWAENELDLDIEDYFRKAGYFGDYYMTVWEGDFEEDEDGNGTVTGVEIFANSPLQMRRIYSRENSRRALFDVKVWKTDEAPDGGDLYRANLYYRDRIEQWATKKGTKDVPTKASDFEEYLEDEEDPESWVVDNEYGELPNFHFRQGSKPYGSPLHLRAFGSQDAVNKLNITHMATVDYQGFPQRYALVDAEAEGDESDEDFLEFDTSGVITPSGAIDSQSARKRKSKLKSGPAETWWLSGVKSVGTFEVADPSVFLDPIKFQLRSMGRLTTTPVSEFDVEDGEVPSGESYRRAWAPTLKDIASIIAGHKRTLANALAFGMKILGHGDLEVAVVFAPIDSASDSDTWNVIGLKLKAGVPLRDVLAEAGYTADKLEEWYPTKDGDVDLPALAPSQLIDIGSALASFGSAVTMQTIGAEQIKRAFPMLFVDGENLEPIVTADEPALEIPSSAPAAPTGPSAAENAAAEANAIKAKADALGALVRAGVSGESAAKMLGLAGLEFAGVPSTVRMNEDEAADLEVPGGGAPKPAPTPAPEVDPTAPPAPPAPDPTDPPVPPKE